MRRPLLGALLLLIAAVIWGFTFVPQKLTVMALPPLTATALRFALASPLALLLAGPRRLRSRAVSVRVPLLLGVLLFGAYVTQTAALAIAPVARVALITGLYAVFVPFLAPWFGLARPALLHWVGAATAFGGLVLLVGVTGGDAVTTPLNVGDALVLAHALLAAVQVLVVSRVARRADPFALNAQQIVVLLLIAAPLALLIDGVPSSAALNARVLLAFGFLAVLSTVVAFTSQIFGQRHASAPTAAVIMLLETPIGLVGALWFFDESMAPSQWLGAVVLMMGVTLSLTAELRRARAAAA